MGSRSPCTATVWFRTAHQQESRTVWWRETSMQPVCEAVQAEGSCDPTPIVEKRSNSVLHSGNHTLAFQACFLGIKDRGNAAEGEEGTCQLCPMHRRGPSSLSLLAQHTSMLTTCGAFPERRLPLGLPSYCNSCMRWMQMLRCRQ